MRLPQEFRLAQVQPIVLVASSLNECDARASVPDSAVKQVPATSTLEVAYFDAMDDERGSLAV